MLQSEEFIMRFEVEAISSTVQTFACSVGRCYCCLIEKKIAPNYQNGILSEITLTSEYSEIPLLRPPKIRHFIH